MIIIKEIDLNAVARLDEELGASWREGELADGDCNEVVTVTLSASTILKAYSEGAILLDKGGVKSSLERYEYLGVVIC